MRSAGTRYSVIVEISSVPRWTSIATLSPSTPSLIFAPFLRLLRCAFAFVNASLWTATRISRFSYMWYYAMSAPLAILVPPVFGGEVGMGMLRWRRKRFPVHKMNCWRAFHPKSDQNLCMQKQSIFSFIYSFFTRVLFGRRSPSSHRIVFIAIFSAHFIFHSRSRLALLQADFAFF